MFFGAYTFMVRFLPSTVRLSAAAMEKNPDTATKSADTMPVANFLPNIPYSFFGRIRPTIIALWAPPQRTPYKVIRYVSKITNPAEGSIDKISTPT